MSTNPPMCAAIAETQLLHKMHRAATSLLADAAERPTAPSAALAELRDFLVAALRHHHEAEDHELWPKLTAADPVAGAGLDEVGAEHVALDETLDTVAAVPVGETEDRTALIEAAVALRDLVHRHIEHEEPVLFPALETHMSDEAWADFSRGVIASAPPVGTHLNIGFFEQVGTPEELKVVMANMPEGALPFIPAMREQALATLDSLQATHHGRTVLA
ncbi:hemerythrin domain-containing protein [Streptomyces sp. NPDC127033]|uniref:hemerythrin domain-containing protein n=1 Tax=Streptomyces sp. NPDC127033 TaxID=3347110 RepID=UPI00366A066D